MNTGLSLLSLTSAFLVVTGLSIGYLEQTSNHNLEYLFITQDDESVREQGYDMTKLLANTKSVSFIISESLSAPQITSSGNNNEGQPWLSRDTNKPIKTDYPDSKQTDSLWLTRSQLNLAITDYQDSI